MLVEKPLLQVLSGKTPPRVPLWLMRQAGRYLPEYRAVREKTAGFLDMCLTPELAAEVTLQPLRRFPLDAAIIFSDILVIPYALGQKVTFEEGRGPVLEPIRTVADLGRLSAARMTEMLAPVEAALRRVAGALPEGAALIGFAGAPWTVASYMIEGGSSRDFAAIKRWAYGDPDSFRRLIDLLVEVTSDYLVRQVDAGAEVLQIFDSWAGVLVERGLDIWALAPTVEIVRRVKAARPGVPIIVFPRGVGTQYAAYAEGSGCDALSLDQAVPLDLARRELQPRVALQGNLDPMLLVAGGAAMRDEAARILETLASGPFVFNLGHGIVPQTPVEHVAELCELVHGWRR
jgi:uroporphyrinogen decarboxylase